MTGPPQRHLPTRLASPVTSSDNRHRSPSHVHSTDPFFSNHTSSANRVPTVSSIHDLYSFSILCTFCNPGSFSSRVVELWRWIRRRRGPPLRRRGSFARPVGGKLRWYVECTLKTGRRGRTSRVRRLRGTTTGPDRSRPNPADRSRAHHAASASTRAFLAGIPLTQLTPPPPPPLAQDPPWSSPSPSPAPSAPCSPRPPRRARQRSVTPSPPARPQAPAPQLTPPLRSLPWPTIRRALRTASASGRATPRWRKACAPTSSPRSASALPTL